MRHYYYGDGKGKTTAAFGLALRALGSGHLVHIAGFLKNLDGGEYAALAPWVYQGRCLFFQDEQSLPFWWAATEAQKQHIKENQRNLWKRCLQSAQATPAGLFVFDELEDVVSLGILTEEEVLEGLQALPKEWEIVVTGHKKWLKMEDICQYVTHMKAKKHPFQNGAKARRGIEY